MDSVAVLLGAAVMAIVPVWFVFMMPDRNSTTWKYTVRALLGSAEAVVAVTMFVPERVTPGYEYEALKVLLFGLVKPSKNTAEFAKTTDAGRVKVPLEAPATRVMLPYWILFTIACAINYSQMTNC